MKAVEKCHHSDTVPLKPSGTGKVAAKKKRMTRFNKQWDTTNNEDDENGGSRDRK